MSVSRFAARQVWSLCSPLLSLFLDGQRRTGMQEYPLLRGSHRQIGLDTGGVTVAREEKTRSGYILHIERWFQICGRRRSRHRSLSVEYGEQSTRRPAPQRRPSTPLASLADRVWLAHYPIAGNGLGRSSPRCSSAVESTTILSPGGASGSSDSRIAPIPLPSCPPSRTCKASRNRAPRIDHRLQLINATVTTDFC